MFEYRKHRGSLSDSMKTVQEFDTRSGLVEYLQNDIDKLMPGEYNCREITIKPYGFDRRIGWDTHIVCLDGYGVLGFTNMEVIT